MMSNYRNKIDVTIMHKLKTKKYIVYKIYSTEKAKFVIRAD